MHTRQAESLLCILASQQIHSFQKMERFPGCCQICAQQHFVFISPPPPPSTFSLHIKRSGSVFEMVRKGGRWSTSKRRKNEPVQAQDKTENTKLLLLLTLKRPVSGIHSPSPPSFLPLLCQPHLFTVTGLERALASPAVSFFLRSYSPCVFLPRFATLKGTEKELRSKDEIFS